VKKREARFGCPEKLTFCLSNMLNCALSLRRNIQVGAALFQKKE
jgi:hypothetical protein